MSASCTQALVTCRSSGVVSAITICTDFLVFARGLDRVLRKHDYSCREHHKSSGRKYCGFNPNSNRVSRNSSEMHSSHVYRGMVNQEEGRLNNCLKRSYAS